MKKRFIVTIDGPAGSGKSTLARLIAQRNSFIHIDTGAIYRAVGCILGDYPSIEALDKLELSIVKDKSIKILYQGRDIEEFIRNERCGMLASKVAKIDYVREFVNRFARRIASYGGMYVIDGRDCGTVIFPDADLKLFLVASVDERAARRAIDENGDVEEIKKLIEQRDKQDRERQIAPLVKAEDAIEIDTTDIGPEEVYDIAVKLIKEKLHENNNS